MFELIAYTMIAIGTSVGFISGVEVEDAKKQFSIVLSVGVLFGIFWPVFWSIKITQKLMDA